MKISEITSAIEQAAPLHYQESYDNSGLITGFGNDETSAVLVCLDVTEEVIDEALSLGCNLVISHHPPVFRELKKFSGNTLTEKIIRKAIKNDIALYAAHTNLDNSLHGVNQIICEKLGIENPVILQPVQGSLKKLVTFVPTAQADQVRSAIFEAGAGVIGNYDCCSYNLEGKGSFRAHTGASPFVGSIGQFHLEEEIRIETIIPVHLQNQVVSAMLKAHPYEEVAYDIYPLDNRNPGFGSGMIGHLQEPSGLMEYLQHIKTVFNASVIRYSPSHRTHVQKIAVCGGSGGFLLKTAIAAGADLFITGETGYHTFMETGGNTVLADAGHFETEQFTIELIKRIIKENFPTFAVEISKSGINPVKYL